MTKARQRAEKMYEDFQGHAYERESEIDLQKPEFLIRLGYAKEIVYESTKLNGGGDGTKNCFIHKFDKGTELFTDECGKTLFIIGKRLQVKKSGINH